MSHRDSDATWNQFGRDDPYYGVLSDPRFRDASKAGPARDEFFRLGAEHIQRVLALVQELSPGFQPSRALDFGCGVGRLVIPLARVAQAVVGLDVSRAMLDEAQRNCTEAGLSNVQWALSDDSLSALSGQFDLIHTYIVLQHIPVARGLVLLRQLIERLVPGGVGAVQITFGTTPRPAQRLAGLVKRLPGVRPLINAIRKAPLSERGMQMNNYPLADVLALLQDLECHRVTLRFSRHGKHRGALLVFQRLAVEPF